MYFSGSEEDEMPGGEIGEVASEKTAEKARYLGSFNDLKQIKTILLDG